MLQDADDIIQVPWQKVKFVCKNGMGAAERMAGSWDDVELQMQSLRGESTIVRP